MYKLEVYIQGNKLDLYKDENVNLNSSIQNIKDISKVFSDYTESFTLPASKNNNKIFKHWYNANISGGFSAKTRQQAELRLNGISYKTGKIQLENVNLVNGIAKDYKITFYGDLINLTDLFGDDLLSSLSLDDYTHDYTYNNVKLGLQGDLFDKDIIYPLISSERNWEYNTPTEANEIKYQFGTSQGIRYSELKPAIRINSIIEAIENRYNVTFSNDFFNNSTNVINDLYLWLNGTVAGSIGANSLDINWNGGDSDNVNFATNIGTFRTYNTSASNDKIEWINYVYIQYDEAYKDTNYSIKIYDGDDLISEVEVNNAYYSSEFGKYFRYVYFKLETKQSGETIYNIRVEIETSEKFEFTTLWRQTKVQHGTDLEFSTTGTSQTIEDDLQITNNLPNIKVTDFFKGLIKMFNLVIDPLSSSEFRIIPLDNWYGEGSNYDLTQYVEADKHEVKKPSLYRNINFSYKEPKAILNGAYFDANKIGYGDLDAEFDVDGGELNIDIPFENLLFERLSDTTEQNLTDIHVSYSFDEDLKAVVLPPVLFFSRGLTNNQSYFGLLDENENATKITNYLNVGQESSTILGNSDVSINFGNELSSWNLEAENISLYSTFWQDYITDLYDDKRREYNYTAYLPLKVINTLRLNDLIQIKGNNYLINNLDANLTNGKVKLNLVNYIGETLNLKQLGTLVATLNGTSNIFGNLSKLSAISLVANLIGTSELISNLTQYNVVTTSALLNGTSSIKAILNQTLTAILSIEDENSTEQFTVNLANEALQIDGVTFDAVNKRITIDASVTPDLQAVTTVGSTISNNMLIQGSTVLVRYMAVQNSGNLNNYAMMSTDGNVMSRFDSNSYIELDATNNRIEGRNNTNFSTYLTFPAATANRTITFPNKSGTIALLSDITSSGIALTDLSATSPILYNNSTGVFSHATTSGNKHIPSGGTTNQILRWSADGTAVWSNESSGGSYVDLSTSQTIGGVKTFTSNIITSAIKSSAVTDFYLYRSNGTPFLTMNNASGEVTANYDFKVPDEAYSSAWNGSLEVPTKNAVYDKINAMDTTIGTKGTVSDLAYGVSWNGNTDVPTKNAVYDKIETLSAGASYSVYTALITQTGTSAPTATVLENTLGGTVVWSRFTTGVYRATLSGAFTNNKTAIFVTPSTVGTGVIISNSNTTNVIQIAVYDDAGDLVDGYMNKVTLEIRVYP